MRHHRPRVSLTLNPGYSKARRLHHPQSGPRSRKTPRPCRPGGRLRCRPAQEADSGKAFRPAATVPNGAFFPLPRLRGRAREGANSTAQTRGKSPLPNPPPQAGEGVISQAPSLHGRSPDGAAAVRRSTPAKSGRELAAFAGPNEWRIRPGPGCRRARPRAGRPCRTRRKIENSLLNSLFSGNLQDPHVEACRDCPLHRAPNEMEGPLRRHARACRGHPPLPPPYPPPQARVIACGRGPLTSPRLRGEVGICALVAQIPGEGASPRV